MSETTSVAAKLDKFPIALVVQHDVLRHSLGKHLRRKTTRSLSVPFDDICRHATLA